MLSSFSSRRLQCETLLRRSRNGGSYAAEFFYQLIKLRNIIINVFVTVLRVEIARQFRGFVRRNFFWSGFDVVADLVAGFVIAAAGQRELIGGGAVPRGAG